MTRRAISRAADEWQVTTVPAPGFGAATETFARCGRRRQARWRPWFLARKIQLGGEALASGSTRVAVASTPDGSETVLVLLHVDVPTSHAPDHDKGRAYFVGERLAAAA
jgi:hypothetical protein